MRRFITENRALLRGGEDYAALYDWSIAKPEEFWASVWKFCGVQANTPYRTVLRDATRMPGATWFEGATLNFAANLLGAERAAAPHSCSRTSAVSAARSTWARAAARKSLSVAEHLRMLGVRKGDRVAAFIANRPEAVVAMLATASLGAVWSSCSADFGVDAVLDRFGQIEPKVLFATDGYFYNGKSIDSMPTMRARRRRACRSSRPWSSCRIARRIPTARGAATRSCSAKCSSSEPSFALRARRIRGPALHSLFIRHDGRAEVHRARRRRHAVAASQGARVSLGHAARRRRVLFHDLRLDDVELARLGAGLAARHSCSTMARRFIPTRRSMATRGAGTNRVVRHEREISERAREVRVQAA